MFRVELIASSFLDLISEQARLKRRCKIAFLLSTDNGRTRLFIFYHIYNHENFILKYPDNALTDFA